MIGFESLNEVISTDKVSSSLFHDNPQNIVSEEGTAVKIFRFKLVISHHLEKFHN